MEKPTDILAFLGRVVQENTEHYRSDFVYDTATLTKAIWEPRIEDRIFYWMSRPAGTWCLKEREVFLRGTSAHSIWTHYAEAPERIRAYCVIVTGQENGHITGEIIPLDYPAQVRRVQAHALPTARIIIQYESGHTVTMPFPEHTRTIPTILPEHGGISRVYYEPDSEEELARIILEERRQQTGKVKKSPAKRRPHPRR